MAFSAAVLGSLEKGCFARVFEAGGARDGSDGITTVRNTFCTYYTWAGLAWSWGSSSRSNMSSTHATRAMIRTSYYSSNRGGHAHLLQGMIHTPPVNRMPHVHESLYRTEMGYMLKSFRKPRSICRLCADDFRRVNFSGEARGSDEYTHHHVVPRLRGNMARTAFFTRITALR